MKLAVLIWSALVVLVLVLAIPEADGNVHDFEGNDLHNAPGTVPGHAGRGFTDSARDILASPAGQLAAYMAKEMISRSAGNSQVLSLNLTNLLILFLLKALIFAAGLIGAGNWSQYARGRSEQGAANGGFLLPGEANLILGYLAAEGSGQDGCLMRSACRAPRTADEYARAAHALMKGAEMFNPEVAENYNYKRLLASLDRAAMEGLQGAPCEMIYACHI
ncbi:AGAP002486-PA-like protein [Anopheles sinensis]|uniref:AGAP002486-PA-like protein n=1 Tax=Anopheles sinensis TaxID=74873 RepID=A0A084VAM8_ANOSI|nr:AGAP002486-PA-like protein [Anopheles sinensis]